MGLMHDTITSLYFPQELPQEETAVTAFLYPTHSLCTAGPKV